ncbi:MAG: Xaa-Pro aminopeptidase [Candidatus Sericytochromatia bacterium]|nr:MAG: Xaa-Pro aminopeptidase [Candidatus Sericytochromatia bacterium]
MFEERRKIFLEKMNGGIAILRNPNEVIRSHDTNYRYRSDSDFYYLTGFNEPNSIALFIPENDKYKYILFVRPRDPEKETWDGRRAGIEGAINDYKADIAYDINDFPKKILDYLKNKDKLYYTFGIYPDIDKIVIDAISNLRGRVRNGDFAPSTIIDIGTILHEMRLIKSNDEIELMKKSNFIAQEAHIQAMKNVKPNMYEYEVEAIIENVFKKYGACSSYNPIIGSGINSTILHYNENNSLMRNGDLLLIDAGAEYNYYASDITRTFPINGKFTPAQKAVYEVVLKAQLEAIKIAKPGIKFHDIHDLAVKILSEGMIEIGLLKGSLDEVIEKEHYKKFYMHRTSHWLGMDVHDRGLYYINGKSRELQKGMILTIEPGIYIQENITDLPKEFIGIGIRIEDDILITENGNENLSERVPKFIDEIEDLMSN